MYGDANTLKNTLPETEVVKFAGRVFGFSQQFCLWLVAGLLVKERVICQEDFVNPRTRDTISPFLGTLTLLKSSREGIGLLQNIPQNSPEKVELFQKSACFVLLLVKRQENNLDLSEQDIVLTSGCCLLKRIMGNLGADAGPGGWELNILRKINIKDNGKCHE